MEGERESQKSADWVFADFVKCELRYVPFAPYSEKLQRSSAALRSCNGARSLDGFGVGWVFATRCGAAPLLLITFADMG